ncbi:MAG: primosomal protein N' [Candidatus Doudnabacteria bacterium]|nr:primosomal protein N' [Candidatus Doudnabacteria bacterium]
MSFANVIPLTTTRRPTSKKTSEAFTYTVPGDVALSLGQEVMIPFGGREVRGVVIETQETTSIPKQKLKALSDGTAPYTISPTSFELARWISHEWLAPLGKTLELFLPPSRQNRTKTRTTRQRAEHPQLAPLTQEQREAVTECELGHSPILLWGVTGAGKTEVYFRRMASVIAANTEAQVLFLVPEIGMIPQMEQRLRERFGQEQFVTVHSKRSVGQRTEALTKAADGTARIVLGTRSALFASFKQLALVIVDECHDGSYVSWEKAPRYDGRMVAEKLAELAGAQLIYGSATPHVELMARTSAMKETSLVGESPVHLVRMRKRVFQDQFPKVRIVDMRTEFREHDNPSSLSWDLREALKETLAEGKQAIVFLNRRGAATAILCKECGWTAVCPTCEIPLTHHLAKAKDVGKENVLMCHHCNHHEVPPASCPECKSLSVKYVGTGTERVELDLQKLLPEARIARMDADTTTQKHAHEALFDAVKHHEVDVLVGTQMVTKGLDLPNVDLVGVINADTLLHMPDMRSHERTFQLLTQVVGRTGRRDTPGRVVVQTYDPENAVIQAVAAHDADTFFAHELKERNDWSYPPFGVLVRVLIEHVQPTTAVKYANEIAHALRAQLEQLEGVELLGPAPAFHARSKGKTRIHMLIKLNAAQKDPIWKILKELPEHARVDIHPESIL